MRYVSTPVLNNPLAAFAKAVVYPVSRMYFGYIIETANDIAYDQGDMGHMFGETILPFYDIGVDFYP